MQLIRAHGKRCCWLLMRGGVQGGCPQDLWLYGAKPSLESRVTARRSRVWGEGLILGESCKRQWMGARFDAGCTRQVDSPLPLLANGTHCLLHCQLHATPGYSPRYPARNTRRECDCCFCSRLSAFSPCRQRPFHLRTLFSLVLPPLHSNYSTHIPHASCLVLAFHSTSHIINSSLSACQSGPCRLLKHFWRQAKNEVARPRTWPRGGGCRYRTQISTALSPYPKD